MTTVTVTGPLLDQGGQPVAGGHVQFVRSHPVGLDDGGLSLPVVSAVPVDGSGQFAAVLLVNDEGDPSGTTYTVTARVVGDVTRSWDIQVAAADGPSVALGDLEPVDGVQIGPSRIDQLAVDTAAADSSLLAGIQAVDASLDDEIVARQEAIGSATSPLSERLGVVERTTDRIWLSAADFVAGSGAPVSTSVPSRYHPCWAMPPDLESRIGASFIVPAGWSEARAELHWTVESALPAGDVYWVMVGADTTDGESLTADDFAWGAIGSAAPDPRVLRVEPFPFAGVLRPGQVGLMRVDRRGDDAPDTYTGNALVIGVLVVKVS